MTELYKIFSTFIYYRKTDSDDIKRKKLLSISLALKILFKVNVLLAKIGLFFLNKKITRARALKKNKIKTHCQV